jgi:hypothetical protein
MNYQYLIKSEHQMLFCFVFHQIDFSCGSAPKSIALRRLPVLFYLVWRKLRFPPLYFHPDFPFHVASRFLSHLPHQFSTESIERDINRNNVEHSIKHQFDEINNDTNNWQMVQKKCSKHKPFLTDMMKKTTKRSINST